MRKYSTIVSIITLIFGFAFYGEKLTINIYDTYYIIAAEVVCFSIWLLFMIIFQLINLKKFLSKNAA
ncbi:hypothetical protein [Christiangramia forsetii]|uniref:Membrane protein n=1 Tax=Christiangramia forsetii (strain DSM 17595 / CGMCC 1.15422 / KT0803) TaxID=411154 RepID=A0M7B3_CHRFK|nr:hypothetical protein [Christiangramia forsetii]CAL68508.1 membrane protein [Christiangramia forsetii KT0803]